MEKMENSFVFQVAKPGIKPESAVEAGITLTPTVNKFEINGLATREIGLASGTGDKDENKTPENSISIIVNEASTDINNKFYVCQGITSNAAKLASHNNEQGKGKALLFTYSGIYSRIMLAAINKDVNSNVVPKERLRQLGLVKGNTALKKVYAKIEKAVENYDIEGETRTLYRLFDFMVTDHNPREIAKKSE